MVRPIAAPALATVGSGGLLRPSSGLPGSGSRTTGREGKGWGAVGVGPACRRGRAAGHDAAGAGPAGRLARRLRRGGKCSAVPRHTAAAEALAAARPLQRGQNRVTAAPPLPRVADAARTAAPAPAPAPARTGPASPTYDPPGAEPAPRGRLAPAHGRSGRLPAFPGPPLPMGFQANAFPPGQPASDRSPFRACIVR